MNIELELRKAPSYKAGVKIGFAYSLVFILSMIYLIFFVIIPFVKRESVHPTSAMIALFIVLISLTFMLPKRKNNFQVGLKDGFGKIPHFITSAINFILLLFVYILGIGPVAIISKIAGKKFLDMKKSGSSWVKRENKKIKIEEFYRTF